MSSAGDELAIALRALAWYADKRNWADDDWGCRSVIQPPDYNNGGQKARNALKRIERLRGRSGTEPIIQDDSSPSGVSRNTK